MTSGPALWEPLRCAGLFEVVILLVTLCPYPGGVALGDVVSAEGRPMSVGVEVVEIKGGNLHYRLSGGRMVDRPIESVTHLQIAGWEPFNAAEKHLRAEQYRQAAEAYETILKELDARPQRGQGTLDRGLLVRCRLVQAYDGLGRFDRAVQVYLDIIERMPEAADGLRPLKLPAADSTFLPAAAEAVDAARRRHGTDVIGQSLARWRATWPGQGRPKPGEIDIQIPAVAGERESAEDRQWRERLTGVETLLRAGKFDEALAALAPLQNEQAGRWRSEVFYWQGRAWMGRSLRAQQPVESIRQDAGRAGLALMRVVIHYPASPLAVECLTLAADLCERTGQAESAARLRAERDARQDGTGRDVRKHP